MSSVNLDQTFLINLWSRIQVMEAEAKLAAEFLENRVSYNLWKKIVAAAALRSIFSSEGPYKRINGVTNESEQNKLLEFQKPTKFDSDCSTFAQTPTEIN